MSRKTFRMTTPFDELIHVINELGTQEYAISLDNVRLLIGAATTLFKVHLSNSNYKKKQIDALTTKFRDAGRRSAPWKPTSERLPGRPQDGSDGNRRLRWLFEPTHKFYANELDATLVEIKYIFQTLSMDNAPPLPSNTLQDTFRWLSHHQLIPGAYIDPIQLVPIDFNAFIGDPRIVQSGHLVPLDRGGRHIPDNTFLMLARSNQIQGNQTFEELLELMGRIVDTHRAGRAPAELAVR